MNNRDDLNLRTTPDRGMGGMLIGGLAIIVLLALVYAWSPWSGSRTADNTPAGTTTGQGSAPQAKSQQAPATPSTNR
jgi:hypothetical protein